MSLLDSTITHRCLHVNRRVMLPLNVQQGDDERDVCEEGDHQGLGKG